MNNPLNIIEKAQSYLLLLLLQLFKSRSFFLASFLDDFEKFKTFLQIPQQINNTKTIAY
jgi:hypothetical protein